MIGLTFEEKDAFYVLSNISKYHLIVSLAPIYPKKKYVDILHLGGAEFVLIEKDDKVIECFERWVFRWDIPKTLPCYFDANAVG